MDKLYKVIMSDAIAELIKKNKELIKIRKYLVVSLMANGLFLAGLILWIVL